MLTALQFRANALGALVFFSFSRKNIIICFSYWEKSARGPWRLLSCHIVNLALLHSNIN